MTANPALYLVGDFGVGKSVLWHARASGVSIAGIQLSLASGARAVCVMASSQEKLDFCSMTLGATAGINFKTQDFAQEIKGLTSDAGVDLIVDFVGQSHIQNKPRLII
jgi:NADPH2:quinone reductase